MSGTPRPDPADPARAVPDEGTPRERRKPAAPDAPANDGNGQAQSLDTALRDLPVFGLSRRRMAWIVGVAATIWIVFVFARQVGDASAATARADGIRADNAALAAHVAALAHERDVIKQESYVLFQARAYQLGGPKDQPFTLAPGAPTPRPDAPGSAALRVGARVQQQSPLNSWLSLLFGPST